jgi:bacterioferritin
MEHEEPSCQGGRRFGLTFQRSQLDLKESVVTITQEEATMGSKAREIIGMDVNELLTLLGRAYCDEWLAYYQYWLGAKLVKGPMKDAVGAELLQHATEELAHADMVAMRIIQLGGTPTTRPQQWYDLTNCGYDPPDDPFVKTLLLQNIKGEQCAIGVYSKLLEITRDKDPVTYNMVLTILQQEVEHEEDLQSLLEDYDLLIRAVRE